MPRILSRHELLPQVKYNNYHHSSTVHHGVSYYGSSTTSTSQCQRPYSPTMSTVSSVDGKKKATKSHHYFYEGLSYRIEDDPRSQSEQSRNDVESTLSSTTSNDTWGYFVDFSSPVMKKDTIGRKSSLSHYR